MPIAPSDLRYYKSTAPDSDGGAIDLAREITSGQTHNLFPVVTAGEAKSGGWRWRKFFVRNGHATEALLAAEVRVPVYPSAYWIGLGWGLDHADDDDYAQSILSGWWGEAPVQIELVSDGADSRDVTVVGESGWPSNVFIEETVALNGVTPVQTIASFVSVSAVYVASLDAARTVTVRRYGGVQIGQVAPNKKIIWWWRIPGDLPMLLGDIPAAGGVRGFWIMKYWEPYIAAGEGFALDVEIRGE